MKIKDGIIGFVVGDCLGVPVEFKTAEELKESPVTEMIGYGTYNQLPGTFSDDSSLTIATMDSIINKKTIDYDDIMDSFSEWLLNARYTPHNEVFDIGITTQNAIKNFIEGKNPLKCGGKDEKDNGNGSLMRCLPIVFYLDELYHNCSDKIRYSIMSNISSLTHRHERSIIACNLYLEIASSILNRDKDLENHIDYAFEKIQIFYKDSHQLKHYKRLFNKDFSNISNTGYVVSTIESVIYCLLTTNSYSEAVLKAVNLGGDTDTRAAICGSLAGLYYGYEDIPIEWILEVRKIGAILKLCELFESTLNKKKIDKLLEYKDYFKKADKNSYFRHFDGSTFRCEYEEEMYEFRNLLHQYNFIINNPSESKKIDTINQIKNRLSYIITGEILCGGSWRKAIKSKEFYKILLNLEKLR